MKLHPISDFKALFPEAFNTLIKDHMEGLDKFKYGGYICRNCEVIQSCADTFEESCKYVEKRKGYQKIKQHICSGCGDIVSADVIKNNGSV